MKYYPALNQITKRYWLEATGVAARMYTKLERNLPRLYKDAMKHIMFISDEKVRRQQEDQLVGMLATTLSISIGHVLSAYNCGQILRIEMCGCNTEEMEQLRQKLENERKKAENDKLRRQKMAMDAFKNGEVDKHPHYLKEYSDKWDYVLDLGIIKHRSNTSFEATNYYLPGPFTTVNFNSFSNQITGASKVSVDVSLTLSLNAEGVRIGVKGSGGFSLSWDGKGQMRVTDVRGGLEVFGGGATEAAVGVTSSMVRGTTVYGEIRPMGNDYLDAFRKDAYGGLTGGPEFLKRGPLRAWRGEYRFEETK